MIGPDGRYYVVGGGNKMLANSRSVVRDKFGKLDRPGRNAGFVIFALLTIVLFLYGTALPQGGSLTLVDTSTLAGPGPGDVAINRTPFGTFVSNASFVAGQPGEIVTHRLEPDGRLTFLTRTPAGREPRQMALARGGEFLVVVNSIDNEVRALRIKNGIPQPVEETAAYGGFLTGRSLLTGSIFSAGAGTGTNPAPSGGEEPFDVAVAFGHIIIVNRGSDNVCSSAIDEFGLITPGDCAETDPTPHVVIMGARGHVAVANDVGQSINIYKWDGNTLEPKSTIPLSARPRDVELTLTAQAFPRVLIAIDTPGSGQDLIRVCSINSNGQPVGCADTPAGHFLTDIDVLPNMFFAPPDFDPGLNMLFAATVNINGPGGADDRDEIRAYSMDATTGTLSPVGAIQTPTVPPNFKQVAVCGDTVVDTEFQTDGILRSIEIKLEFPFPLCE